MNALASPAAYRAILSSLWIAWVAYWAMTALRSKKVERRESSASRASHVVPLMIAAWLLVRPPLDWRPLALELLPATITRYQVGVALVVVGLLFSVWARIHLAGNWSASVT